MPFPITQSLSLVKRYASAMGVVCLLALPQFIVRLPPTPPPPPACLSAVCTTLGTVTLTPTFDNIGVKVTYTNDTNTNNTATLQYRVQGSGTWLDAHTAAYSLVGAAWPDRRSTFPGNGGTVSNAANQNQFRASIVGLTAGLTYEVKTVISDPDGLSADGTQISTVTMLSTSTLAPQSGNTRYLDTNAAGGGDGLVGTPYNTWTNAQSGTSCGDTLIIKATSGASAGVTFNKNCSTSNWYQVQCVDQSVVAFSEGIGTTPNLTITNGHGAKFENCRFGSSSDSVVTATTGSSNLWFDNDYFVDMNTDAPSGTGSATWYYQAEIKILDGGGAITITNNSFNESKVHAPPADHSTSGGGRVIMFGDSGKPSTAGRYIIKGNTMDGQWSDCIGGSPESEANVYDNSDILNNTITSGSCNDDAIQPEGRTNNMRIGGNIVTSDTLGTSCISMQSNFVGPTYVYRNICDYAGGAYVYKVGGAMNTYWFHNTGRETHTGSGVYCWGSSGGTGAANNTYLMIVNNICVNSQNPASQQWRSTGSTMDYNQYYRVNAGIVIETWNGTTNYNTICCAGGSFFNGTGQEAHGLLSDPLLDGFLHISASSPSYNTGVIIPNFDGPNSAWPLTHAGATLPSRGAFEVP